MTDARTTPEIDILVAASGFLMKRGVKPYQFSPPKGAGIDSEAVHSQIWMKAIEWIANGQDIRPIDFPNEGPDIIGISETEWWQIECKGSGFGKESTLRNHFDRALASVVSYYRERPEGLPERYTQHSNAQPYLGLALPTCQTYMNELNRRVRQPLRKTLNLWVLLYEPKSGKIRAISPEDSY